MGVHDHFFKFLQYLEECGGYLTEEVVEIVRPDYTSSDIWLANDESTGKDFNDSEDLSVQQLAVHQQKNRFLKNVFKSRF